MKKLVALLSAVAVVGVTYNSIAQDMTPEEQAAAAVDQRKSLFKTCLLYTSPSPRDRQKSRMPSSA